MKKLFLFLTIVGFSQAQAQAQIKLPVFDPDAEGKGAQQVVFKDATKANDFRHGSNLLITRKDDSKMRGTLVRVDRAAKKLYVRTQPGAAPVAVDEKDIKKVEKATYAIRPVGTQEDNVVQPEIQRVVVYNGSVASVNYIANTLSSGERSYLQGLQDAENNVMRLQSMADMKTTALDNEMDISYQRRRSSAIINNMLQRQQWLLGTFQQPWMWNGGYSGFAYGANGFGVGPYYNYSGYGYPGASAPAYAGALGESSSTYNVMNVNQNQPDLLKVMMPSQQEAQDLAKARETLATAQSRLAYEDGQIIAVVAKE